MIRKSRKLLQFRKQIIKLLTEKCGYEYVDKRPAHKAEPDMNAWMLGPGVDDVFLLADLERINTGEAHYRVDMPCTSMHFLGVLQNHPHPKKPVPDRKEALTDYFEKMFFGQEFEITHEQCGYDRKQKGRQFGTVQFVDWTHPERNSYTVYEGWRGVLNDDVAWDLIISVNHIPVCAVMMAPTTPGHRPCEEAYAEMRRQLDADRCLSTYCMFCIISDGQTTLVGSPDDPQEWFFPWEAPHEELDRCLDAELGDMKLVPYYALLRPEMLCRYVNGFVRPNDIIDYTMVRFASTSHQFYAVQAALHHLQFGKGKAFAVLPEADDEARPYPIGSNYDTMRQLLMENFSILYNFMDEDQAADPEANFQFIIQPKGAPFPEGVCVYYARKPLKSPLA